MKLYEKIVQRLTQLIEEANVLQESNARGHALNAKHYQNCRGWITASQNILLNIFPDGKSPYVQHIESALREGEQQNWEYVPAIVGEISASLKNLRTDLEAGLLYSIADRTRAETFDNFLDHARAYLARGYKNEAGVIAGVVFEDTLRRVAVKHSIEETGQKLDSLISALAASGAISGAMAKRSRVAAHVRTKATHAQWDEFETGDIDAAIAVTDELVLSKLDG